MRTRAIALFLLTLALAASISACGGPTPQEEPTASAPTATAVVQPTATAKPQGTPEPTEVSLPEVRPLDDLASYRTETIMTMRVGTEAPDTWVVTQEYVKEPLARRWTSEGGPEGSEEVFEVIEAGGVTYMRTGEEWVSFVGEAPLDEEVPRAWAWMVDVNGLDAEYCRLVGQEKVGAYDTEHYTCSMEALTGESGELAGKAGEIREGQVHIWHSSQYEVLVRSLLEYTIQDDQGQRTYFSLQSTVSNINEPIEISPPEGVAVSSLPEDIPIMEGAKDLQTTMGIVQYTVEKPAAEVAAWYRDSMNTQGWTAQTASTDDVMLFVKGKRNATILLEAQDSATSVTLMVMEE